METMKTQKTTPQGPPWYSLNGTDWYASPEAARYATAREIAIAGAETDAAKRIVADPFAAAFDGI